MKKRYMHFEVGLLGLYRKTPEGCHQFQNVIACGASFHKDGTWLVIVDLWLLHFGFGWVDPYENAERQIS